MAEPLNAKSYYIFGAHFFCLKILTKISYENIFFKKKKPVAGSYYGRSRP